MRRTSKILFFALILSYIFTHTSAGQSKGTKGIPCFNESLLGSWEQKDCLAKEIPGFAGFINTDCTMVVYLTTLDQIDKARAILEPLYSQSGYTKIACKSGTRVVIHKARYSWSELREWMDRVSYPKSGGVTNVGSLGIDEEKNAVDIFFEDEADVPRARETLDRLGIPQDACILRSRAEMDRPRMVQIRDGELVIPAFIADDQRVGDLILGQTTLTQAQSMFPVSPPGYEGRPRKPEGYPKSKFGEVSPKPKLQFNPWESMYALFFDKNERLVIVTELGSLFEGKTVAEVNKIYPGLRKTETIEGYYEMQTELTPCAALMVMVSNQTYLITHAAYVYTCKTER